jgi:sulfate permease, SulP family
MNASTLSPIPATQPTFAELYTPKLVTILREGYGLKDLRADAIAGMTVAIVGAFLFLHRMAEAVEVASGVELIAEDKADINGARTAYDTEQATDPEVMIYRISGALFFGATAAVSTVLDRVGAPPRSFVLDFSNVPLVDITAANALRGFVQKLERSGTRIYFAGARAAVRKTLEAMGFKEPTIRYAATAAAALEQAKTHP